MTDPNTWIRSAIWVLTLMVSIVACVQRTVVVPPPFGPQPVGDAMLHANIKDVHGTLRSGEVVTLHVGLHFQNPGGDLRKTMAALRAATADAVRAELATLHLREVVSGAAIEDLARRLPTVIETLTQPVIPIATALIKDRRFSPELQINLNQLHEMAQQRLVELNTAERTRGLIEHLQEQLKAAADVESKQKLRLDLRQLQQERDDAQARAMDLAKARKDLADSLGLD